MSSSTQDVAPDGDSGSPGQPPGGGPNNGPPRAGPSTNNSSNGLHQNHVQ